LRREKWAVGGGKLEKTTRTDFASVVRARVWVGAGARPRLRGHAARSVAGRGPSRGCLSRLNHALADAAPAGTSACHPDAGRRLVVRLAAQGAMRAAPVTKRQPLGAGHGRDVVLAGTGHGSSLAAEQAVPAGEALVSIVDDVDPAVGGTAVRDDRIANIDERDHRLPLLGRPGNEICCKPRAAAE
jgi:hypothetical protein